MPTSANAKENTAIILIPGSFSPASFFHKVASALNQAGYHNVQPCDLLSACPLTDQRRPPAKLEDDALYIRETVQAFLEKGKDVVLVMNSYGGFPGTEAIKGLPSRGKLGDGSQGAVVGMLYLSSFMPLPGDSLRSVMGDYLFEPLKTGIPGGYMTLDPASGPGIFNEMFTSGREEEGKWYFDRMLTHSSDSFDGKVTHDMWGNGSFQGQAVYLAGDLDLVVPWALTEGMVKVVEGKASPGKVKVVKDQEGGHVMHVSKPSAVVSAIEELIGELQK